MHIQESSCEVNEKFNFLGKFGRAKGPGECIFQAFSGSIFKNTGYEILGSVETSHFELLRGWDVCI